MTIAEATTIEERMARIEASLNQITAMLNQAPVLLSMATDTADELLSNAKNQGTDVDQRLQNGLQLLGRLSDPEITKTINGLLDFVEQAPGLFSMVADTVDAEIGVMNQGAVRLDDRIKGVGQLLERVSDPSMVEKLDKFMDMAEQGPGLMAMTLDSVDELMSRHGKDINDLLSFLHKDNLLVLKNAGAAFTEAQHEPPAKVGGLFGMLRTLKDPGRQKALGLLMNVLKNFGNKI